MEKQKIVITGGPSSGKTSLIDVLMHKNFSCFPEISREISIEAQKKGIEHLFVENPIGFSEKVLEGRLKQFELANQMSNEVIFFDRGIPDVEAYLGFSEKNHSIDFETINAENRYSKIFILPPWEAIHENDAVRYESFAQAQEIYNHIKSTYEKYGYEIIEIPKVSIENRISFILNALGIA